MRVGVLGLGSIGIRHLDNLVDMGHQVVGYDPNVKCGSLLGTVTEASSMEEFFQSEMDAVVIASPSSLHVQHLKMLDLYKTRVLIEKPIGATEADAKILKEVVGLRWISVGNNLRFHPCVEWAKRAIDGIGKIRQAYFCCNQFNSKPDYIRDGVTLNWGAHEIDLALHLLGPATVKFSSINEEDTVANILLTHDSGCETTIDLDYIRNPHQRDFLIWGEYGNVSSNLEKDPPDFDWNQTYLEEIEDFIEYGGGQCATAAEGLAVLRIILDAKRKAGL